MRKKLELALALKREIRQAHKNLNGINQSCAQKLLERNFNVPMVRSLLNGNIASSHQSYPLSVEYLFFAWQPGFRLIFIAINFIRKTFPLVPIMK